MTRKEAFNMLDQMARGIAEMFGSNCETIIHDLEDPHHPILAIYNGHVSGRTVGSTQDLTGAERDLYLDDDVGRCENPPRCASGPAGPGWHRPGG